jgi:hypothetical protein
MTLSWPNHLLSLQEWEALPEIPDLRLELAEGVLVISPAADVMAPQGGNQAELPPR